MVINVLCGINCLNFRQIYAICQNHLTTSDKIIVFLSSLFHNQNQMTSAKIIIVDDNEAVLHTLKTILKPHFTTVITVANPQLIPSLIAKDDVDVMLLDMNFGIDKLDGEEGLFWLNRIKTESNLKRPPSVVLITAFGDIELAVKSLKNGADDFVTKPWNNDRLIQVINETIKKRNSSNEENRDDAAMIIINALLKKFSEMYGKVTPSLTVEARRYMENLCMQGNVDEARDAIERTMLLSYKTIWDVNDLPTVDSKSTENKLSLEELERQFIAAVLKDNAHNLVTTAQQLGISRQTLYNKMRRYELG